MIRGTTPKHKFVLPFTVDNVATARVVYSQSRTVIFVKTGDDLILSGNQIEIHLTQADTLSFRPRETVEIQVRILTPNGDALASGIHTTTVECCLENEVME